MGILDMFTGGNGPAKAAKLKGKVTQKWGDPTGRQKAIADLGEMKIPEAVTALLARFTVSVEPSTTDIEEKEHVCELIRGFGQTAVGPLVDFLKRNDTGAPWVLRILEGVIPEPQLVGVCTDYLSELGEQYSRDPEKKLVLINFVADKDDPRIAPALVPLLEDMSDDVKIAALKALGPRKHEPAREPILKILTDSDSPKRVQTVAIEALHESGFGVQGYREKVEARVGDPYFVDRSGQIQKRG